MHTVGAYVTLKAATTGRADRIELFVTRFSVDEDGNESQDTPKMLVKVCNPAGTAKSLNCTYDLAYSGDAKIIEFHGRAKYPGASDSNEVYRFASGIYPVTDKPTPIRAKRETIDGFDIVVVPDPDMLNSLYDYPWESFRSYLDDFVEDIYFAYGITRENRDRYNFWYVPGTAIFDQKDCTFTGITPAGDEHISSDLTTHMESFADALVYVHAGEKWDCAEGTRFSTEIWYDKSVLHETAHVLYELRDEYPIYDVGKFGPQPEMGNTFSSLQRCEDEASSLGLSEKNCVRISTYDQVWRVDPTGAQGCVMGPSQHATWSDFGPACSRRIHWTHDRGDTQ